MSIMEEFKVLGLGSEMTIGTKPLPSKESPIIALIEAFHDTITPRFSYRDEYHLDTHDQAESQNDAKGARVAIASTETEFVVELEKIGDSHGLPAAIKPKATASSSFLRWGLRKTRWLERSITLSEWKRPSFLMYLDPGDLPDGCD